MDYRRNRNEGFMMEQENAEFGKLGGIQWFIWGTMMVYFLVSIAQKLWF